MREQRQPSQTALAAAAARGAHLVVDQQPFIFEDPVALPLLGEVGQEMLRYHRASGDHVVLAGTRAQVTVRSRYAEERLAALARDGLAQYVLLGAGLDTFAYRSPLAGNLRVFEVDHPATQRWKRDLLGAAGIAPLAPERLAFVGVDLETDALLERLADAGFDPSRPALVSWLGVSMYLTGDAVAATLAAIGSLAAGTELVMEYALPAELRDARGAAYATFALQVAAERGEPWLSFFTPDELAELLHAHGLSVVERRSQQDAVDPSLWRRDDALVPADLCRLARATVRPGAGSAAS
jgi:methyltransferase (TIGR00027 family)